MPSRRVNKKSLCIIGESQAAMFKLLHDADSDAYSDWDVDFFCRPGNGLASVKIEDGQLLPVKPPVQKVTTDLDEVDLCSYHAVIMAGMHIPTSTIFACLTEYADGFISNAFLADYLSEQFAAFPYYALATQIAAVRQGPTYLSPSPFFVDIKDLGFIRRNPNITEIERNGIWTLLDEFVAGDSIELIRQPEKTVSNGFCTKPEYGALNRSGEPDLTHCSDKYAALIVEQFFVQQKKAAAAA